MIHGMKMATKDPRAVPAYTLADVARFARVPTPTLRSWVTGRNYRTHGGPERFKPLIVPASPTHLSFINLVEAHVLAAIRRNHGVPMHKVRSAIDYVGRELGVQHPLAREKFETDGVSLFIRRLEKLFNASESGQVAMQDVLSIYLQRIRYDEAGMSALFFPFTRATAERDQPQEVVINPAVMWGRPVILGTRIDTRTVFSRYRAGETLDEIAEDFNLTLEQVDEAVRSEIEWAA